MAQTAETRTGSASGRDPQRWTKNFSKARISLYVNDFASPAGKSKVCTAFRHALFHGLCSILAQKGQTVLF
jgi:hypothetical protein